VARINTSSQSDHDSGMHSLDILQRLIRADKARDLLDEVTPVSFTGCLHLERSKLLDNTMEWAISAMDLYKILESPCEPVGTDQNLTYALLGEMEAACEPKTVEYRRVKRQLHKAMSNCLHCTDRRTALTERYGLDVEDNGLVASRARQHEEEGGTDAEEYEGMDRETGEGRVDAGNHRMIGREAEDLSEGESDEDEEKAIYVRKLLRLAKRSGGTVVTGLKEATRKSKPVQPYPFEEERPMVVVKTFDPNFDNYRTGPTVEELVEEHKELCLAFHFDPAAARWFTSGERFSDHGYRRTNGGFHQFYLNDPSEEEQLAHFFPLPPKAVIDEWRKRKDATDVDEGEVAKGKWHGHRLPEDMIKADDLESWTLGKMVGPEAGELGTEDGMRTYITGKTRGGKYIRLDVEKSRKVVENLDFAIDIDSILWVTDKLKVLGSINLHLLPHKGMRAPIKTHNHAYVELYWPRTNEDLRKGKRSNTSKLVPISTLPNTHFAHFGRSHGSAEVFVVFPRMKHKYPLRKVSETKIPSDVEAFWLERVVYKAMKMLEQKGIGPYINWDLEDTKFKHGDKLEHTLLISPSHLDHILETIRSILEENEDDESYSRFGSLFFVVQILGIKVSTSLDNGWHRLWDKLLDEQRNLDWDYMKDTENGELLVDVGFGIHPPEDAAVVGFWDVDALRQSYDYGGYSNGTTHGVNTVPAIGATTAEMTSRRKKRTHVAYRLTYNLHFEIVRSHRTKLKEGFFPPSMAYKQTKDYGEMIQEVTDAYHRSISKSYGVRDEYRCRAGSVKRLLPQLMNKVRSLLLRARSPNMVLNYGSTGRRIRQSARPHHLAFR
jgi:hypothetical protein